MDYTGETIRMDRLLVFMSYSGDDTDDQEGYFHNVVYSRRQTQTTWKEVISYIQFASAGES